MLLSIILFFVFLWSFGLVISFFIPESNDFIERNLMRLGIGLGMFLTTGFIFNLIKIPLDWKIFLLLSISIISARVFIDLKKNKLFSDFKEIKLNFYALAMLSLVIISFGMYHKGAFAYPYLEDDDSWGHTVGTKYISIEKTYLQEKVIG